MDIDTNMLLALIGEATIQTKFLNEQNSLLVAKVKELEDKLKSIQQAATPATDNQQ